MGERKESAQWEEKGSGSMADKVPMSERGRHEGRNLEQDVNTTRKEIELRKNLMRYDREWV